VSSYFFDWCESCKLNHFQLNYGEFPSGNNEIDKILKYNYCKSRSSGELIEWIPYNEFKDIVHIAYHKEIYSADWPKGYICYWNSNNLNWDRRIKNFKVMLINSEDLDHIYKVSIFSK